MSPLQTARCGAPRESGATQTYVIFFGEIFALDSFHLK